MNKPINEGQISLVFERQKGFAQQQPSIDIRKKHLIRIRKWILANKNAFHTAVYEDLKKPTQEVDISEILVVLQEIKQALSNLDSWTAKQPLPTNVVYLGTKAYTMAEPKGVCLIISPWNYPVSLSLGPLISALAAGNSVILKPSEFTPSVNSVILSLVNDLFKTEEVAVITGDAQQGKLLLTQPFDHIFFTGSTNVGKVVMEAASKKLSSVTLELGGKSPTIIDETANIPDAARKIAWGKWLNAGQTCIAPDYVLVHQDVRDHFISVLRSEVLRMYSNPEEYTSIISLRHYNRLKTLYEQTVKEEDVTIDLSPDFDETNLKISPAIISGVALSSSSMSEEIFGPILPVLTFTDIHDPIKWITERPKPLALYHFSTSKKYQDLILQRTSAGTMVYNDCVLQFGHPHLPFGGVNWSGFGRSHGYQGFLSFSNQKSVLRQRTGWTISRLIYPPFSNWKNKLIEIMLKYF